ncbi:MAG: response regulator, partial [Ruminococcus sp.]|nr:response regulator [Ruminococcus sp.]
MTNYAEILVVDDMPDHIAYSGTILRSEGYRVFAASSGKAAIKFLETKIPDLIMLDIQMDDISGLELCEMFKKNSRTKDIPVIFLTAEMSPEIIQQGFSLG